MPRDLLSGAALAAAEASAVAALANAAAKKRVDEKKSMQEAEAAALANLAKAAANQRDAPRAPKMPPPRREAPAPPEKPPTWMERQVLQAAHKGKRPFIAPKDEHAEAPWHKKRATSWTGVKQENKW
mmetsp:Transcript_84203/g.132999  ORF Transcript_84203/g.132999 Transcript_84203/m.132999 type:complete len:127 (+) Transcript_84203:79-459(+)|eukprot:CAMPEP_0169107800 /NCGR_PEP_ID=MMETSP1015-20121227/25081_1 /TAXON_ID=342587 /ORGANISM="Karlodinium micrum, Strain CCMP2283" /LENGTH=126 /DNA_ID=CAMNT_0009169367 /DNA_START=58 /DNA_END=438 /DNA_ORIENTATION=+